MSEVLQGSAGRNFFKWNKEGDEILVRLTEAPTYGRPNPFGGVDNFLVGEGPDGSMVQVPLPTDALAKVRKADARLVPGKTVLCLRYAAIKMLGKGKSMKVFEIEADGLAPAQEG